MRRIAFLLLLAACDPPFEMKGDVVDGDGKPIANAHVALVCDGTEVRRADSDGSGRFDDREIGFFPLRCTVEVHAANRPVASIPLRDVCMAGPREDTCNEIVLHAHLARR
ncbi:MAG: carboxypeptidase regulatory-like domain-containing protein [Deltaproteobacteria bacterium]|nr:carboxypeptidase regulatory-like domain-containing protein [Deltaproteobacteria bacterium]